MLSRRRGRLVVALALVAMSAGCGAEKRLRGLSDDELYRRAEAAMAAGKPGRAIPIYEKINTAASLELRAQVHLRLADAYYDRGGFLNLAEAQSRYQSFLNAFPLSDQAAYAQYRFATCLATAINKPERDQAPTRRAIAEFGKVMELYPNSPWAGEARLRIDDLEDHLTRDAVFKARFYFKRKSWEASIARFRGVLDANPDFEGNDEVLYFLGLALRRAGRGEEGAVYLDRLRADYPASDYARKAAGLKPAS